MFGLTGASEHGLFLEHGFRRIQRLVHRQGAHLPKPVSIEGMISIVSLLTWEYNTVYCKRLFSAVDVVSRLDGKTSTHIVIRIAS